jgi:hypothetical protein
MSAAVRTQFVTLSKLHDHGYQSWNDGCPEKKGRPKAAWVSGGKPPGKFDLDAVPILVQHV